MAIKGRKLTAEEKKAVKREYHGSVNPNNYLVEKVLASNRTERTLLVRHRDTGEHLEFHLNF